MRSYPRPVIAREPRRVRSRETDGTVCRAGDRCHESQIHGVDDVKKKKLKKKVLSLIIRTTADIVIATRVRGEREDTAAAGVTRGILMTLVTSFAGKKNHVAVVKNARVPTNNIRTQL